MIKMCSTCKQEKILSDFRKDRTQRDGYQPRCKLCARAQHKSAYTIKYGEKARKRNSERNREQREKILLYKKTHPCIICGEIEPCCLDFHHLDPAKKDFQMSHPSVRSWETILAEINKCAVLCKNCHAKVHASIIIL